MVSKALVAASAKPMILSLLRRGESYGYRILQSVRELSGGTLEWSEAMLYPVLHRMEKDGFIVSQWKLSEEGRMRKYYLLTDLGREEYEQEKEQWLNVHSALIKLWKPVEALE